MILGIGEVVDCFFKVVSFYQAVVHVFCTLFLVRIFPVVQFVLNLGGGVLCDRFCSVNE